MNLIAKQLGYEQGQTKLLSNISFGVDEPQLVGIIGPNGAGKSTLLKLLSGYYEPSGGQVLLNDQNVHQIESNQRARQVSYLPQSNRIEFPYQVQELVGLGLLHARLSGKKAIERAIDGALSALDILHLKHRSIADLSGGEQQLVHLARILLQDTPVVLLDEPGASLDIGHEAQLMNLLHRLTTQDKTVLVALHNLNTAAEFCHRLLFVREGELLADGTPAEVLTQSRIESIYPDGVLVEPNATTGNPNVLTVKY